MCCVEQVEMLVMSAVEKVHCCRHIIFNYFPACFVENPNETVRARCLF